MRTSRITKVVSLAALLLAASLMAVVANAQEVGQPTFNQKQVEKKVRKALLTLPFFGVFDNLAYQIEDGTVTLSGQVVRPTTRRDAARRVARLSGVKQVVNNIEVLPLSPFDDSIRLRTARAIFRTNGLSKYGFGANPSIHIIVNRGSVTLEGVVLNRLDKQLAYFAAIGVADVFSVTNNLRTEEDEGGY
jgi:hyperosmotically inducible protein